MACRRRLVLRHHDADSRDRISAGKIDASPISDSALGQKCLSRREGCNDLYSATAVRQEGFHEFCREYQWQDFA